MTSSKTLDVFKQSVRTNNDLEGWHNRLNRRTGCVQAVRPNQQRRRGLVESPQQTHWMCLSSPSVPTTT